jgi:hypothetical protein
LTVSAIPERGSVDPDLMLPSGRRKTAAWLVCLLAVGAALLGLGFGYAEQAIGRSVIPQSVLSYFAAFVVALGYASVGLALVLRRPRLVIGWLFLGVALVAGFSSASSRRRRDRRVKRHTDRYK